MTSGRRCRRSTVTENLVRGTKIPGKLVPEDQKNLVRTRSGLALIRASQAYFAVRFIVQVEFHVEVCVKYEKTMLVLNTYLSK